MNNWSDFKTMFKARLNVLILLLFMTSVGCTDFFQNREKLELAFKDNFRFNPPESVKTIRLKNRGYFDFEVHYMAFTYDSDVLKKIIEHDQPLNIAESNTMKFGFIIEDLEEDSGLPSWFDIPDSNVDRIYYKNDFLDHTFSEYYLWTNNKTQMVYLYVHFFD